MNFLKHNLLWLSALVYRSNSGKILFYHDVFAQKRYTFQSIQLEAFRAHIDRIAECGFVITAGLPKEKQVMITFDDGWAGIWDCRDYFIQKGIRPTIFLAVELIGRPGYLTQKQILELQRDGFIFEAHSWTHQDLTIFTQIELQHELFDCRDWLTDFLGHEVTQLCFPIGYFSPLVLEEARRAGYTALFSSIPGDVDWHPQPQVITRNLVQFFTPDEVEYTLHGGLIPFSGRYQKRHFRN